MASMHDVNYHQRIAGDIFDKKVHVQPCSSSIDALPATNVWIFSIPAIMSINFDFVASSIFLLNKFRNNHPSLEDCHAVAVGVPLHFHHAVELAFYFVQAVQPR